jgi:hypothetical protein
LCLLLLELDGRWSVLNFKELGDIGF